MTSKHTPGPWKVQPAPFAPGDIQVVLQDDFRIYIPLMATDWDDAKRQLMRANAKLIAAAPETAAERDTLKAINAELLEALEALLPIVGAPRTYTSGDVFEAQDKARAVIAKAKENDTDS